MAKVRLTREEFETIIRNYASTGKDTTELKKALVEAYPPKPVATGNPPSRSPQRRKLVAAGVAAAPPPEFSIEPITEAGIIAGFTIYDPTGGTIRHRGDIVELIHKQFPGISKEKMESARIGYEDYIAHVRLPE